MNTSESGLAIQVRRIYSEYLEMPGLRLTFAQAQRLWGLDAPTCMSALQTLVEGGFLRRTEAGHYLRMTDGSPAAAPLRMAKAGVTRTTASRIAV